MNFFEELKRRNVFRVGQVRGNPGFRSLHQHERWIRLMKPPTGLS